MEVRHLAMAELEAGLAQIRQAPADRGELQLIVRRPAKGEREVLNEGQLDLIAGLVGDNWAARGASATPKRVPNPETQLTIMNTRAAQLIAGSRERWPLAGDQLYLDMDLGLANLPAGTRLAIGSAVVEVTAEPHTGCKQFVGHFGMDAMLFVNSPEGKALCLRGINTRVVQAGTVRVGDTAAKC
ncbi:MAG: MOSC domain-containing protein [Candidatus Latescibacteria bacterium]|nr:MOSC domain-containing protein [Candidatus Latescibacterota bacterium]